MKKIVSVILVILVFAAVLSGCGSSTSNTAALSGSVSTNGSTSMEKVIGILSEQFMAKVAPPKAAAVIRTAVQLLAGIPSVVYGLVGMIVLVPGIQKAFGLPSGATLLAAIIVLAIMILPSIINVSETALRSIPREYEDASLALGCGKWRMVRTVVLPNAIDGIVTECILAVGRIVGESAALLYTAGFGLQLQSFQKALPPWLPGSPPECGWLCPE